MSDDGDVDGLVCGEVQFAGGKAEPPLNPVTNRRALGNFLTNDEAEAVVWALPGSDPQNKRSAPKLACPAEKRAVVAVRPKAAGALEHARSSNDAGPSLVVSSERGGQLVCSGVDENRGLGFAGASLVGRFSWA